MTQNDKMHDKNDFECHKTLKNWIKTAWEANDSRWLKITQDQSKWLKIGSRWVKMTQNDSRWLKMTQDDSKWLIMSKINSKMHEKPMIQVRVGTVKKPTLKNPGFLGGFYWVFSNWILKKPGFFQILDKICKIFSFVFFFLPPL